VNKGNTRKPPNPNKTQEYIARKLIQWNKVKEFKQQLADNRKKPNAYFGYAVSIPITVSECVVVDGGGACDWAAACLPACTTWMRWIDRLPRCLRFSHRTTT